jgi:hypothetical protein
MGLQSQRRLTLTQRRHQLQQYTRERTQVTLTGQIAFDPLTHCAICKARAGGYAEPHRTHHKLSWNNKRTNGITLETTFASNRETTRRLEAHFSRPVQAHEKFSSCNNTRAASFAIFAPRKKKQRVVPKAPVAPKTTMPNPPPQKQTTNVLSAKQFCKVILSVKSMLKKEHTLLLLLWLATLLKT